MLLISLSSCFKERFELTEMEKEFNPYNAGDVLIMHSSQKEIDTLHITKVDLAFNDGVGIIEYKQSLRVWEGIKPKKGSIMDHRKFLLEIRAGGSKEPTYVEFENFDGNRLYLSVLDSLPFINLTTEFGNYNDVIEINGRKDKRWSSFIYKIKWSRKNGIVEYEKGDSTKWTLKKIIRNK